jgi:hypothetical protein
VRVTTGQANIHVRPNCLEQARHHLRQCKELRLEFIANQNGPHRVSNTSAHLSGQEYVPYFRERGQRCLCMPTLPISHPSAEDFSKGRKEAMHEWKQTKVAPTGALSALYRNSTIGSRASRTIQRTRSRATKACTKGWTTSHQTGGLDCECTGRSPKPHCSTATYQQRSGDRLARPVQRREVCLYLQAVVRSHTSLPVLSHAQRFSQTFLAQ